MERREPIADIAMRLKAAHGAELGRLIGSLAGDPRAGVQRLAANAARRVERERTEEARVRALYETARKLGGSGFVLGVDEVGRGSVAGPLTVAAVALPAEPMIIGIDDSKRLSPKKRELLAGEIRKHALAIGICHVPPTRIDAWGMARSLREAMTGAIRQASDAMGREPDAVLIDGRRVDVHPREVCVVKGDATVAPIAAASIVAKVTRDAILTRADEVWPGYAFASSKGYASASHIAAIREHGLTPYHRRSFCTRFIRLDDQSSLF